MADLGRMAALGPHTVVAVAETVYRRCADPAKARQQITTSLNQHRHPLLRPYDFVTIEMPCWVHIHVVVAIKRGVL